jgi:hypothetical protein
MASANLNWCVPAYISENCQKPHISPCTAYFGLQCKIERIGTGKFVSETALRMTTEVPSGVRVVTIDGFWIERLDLLIPYALNS